MTIDFVVDTGFMGYLTLPLAAVKALGLRFIRRIRANLADDSTIHVRVYAATIIWNEEEREVAVLATGKRPLLGTLLLDGCELSIREERGAVLAVPLETILDGVPSSDTSRLGRYRTSCPRVWGACLGQL